jgi:tetratricopeptide (TPR) repeat protein
VVRESEADPTRADPTGGVAKPGGPRGADPRALGSIGWICAALIGACAWFQPSVAGSDLWWHLASGRDIWERGQVPTVDSFSFTFAGREWMNHEWLWDLLYWGLYRIDPEVLAFFHLSILLATYALVLRCCVRFSGSPGASALVLWAAAASAHWFLDIRPHVYTLLLTAVLLATHERPLRLWLWPPLLIVWTNVHAGFVFGIGVVGLLAVVHSVRALRAGSGPLLGRLRPVSRDWICVGLCMAAALLNPWGWRILEYPLAYMPGVSQSTYSTLIEWRPPGLALDGLAARGLLGWLATFQGRFMVLAALVAAGALRSWRPHPFLVSLAAVALLMALRSRRFIPLFGVCAAPLAAIFLAAVLADLQARLQRFAASRRAAPAVQRALAGERGRVAGAVAALALALLFWRGSPLRGDLFETWTQSDLYPRAAARYLAALGPPARVLNLYNWGGYLMLHVPGAQVFIDGRANTLYDETLLGDYMSISGGDPGVRARLARHRPDIAMFPNDASARALLDQSPPWRLVYGDVTALLLVPPDSPLLSRPLPEPGPIVGEEPQYLRQLARALRSAGDLDGARAKLEAALARDPLQVGAYTELAEIAVTRGDMHEAVREIERGVAVQPRRRSELRGVLGSLLVSAGDLSPALPALRSALPTGPFADPLVLSRQINLVLEVERRSQSVGSGPRS